MLHFEARKGDLLPRSLEVSLSEETKNSLNSISQQRNLCFLTGISSEVGGNTSIFFYIIQVEWRKMLPPVPSSQSRSEQHSEWNFGKLLHSANWQQTQKSYAISEVSSESSPLLSHTQHLVSLFCKLLQPQGYLGSFTELDRLRRRPVRSRKFAASKI